MVDHSPWNGGRGRTAYVAEMGGETSPRPLWLLLREDEKSKDRVLFLYILFIPSVRLV